MEVLVQVIRDAFGNKPPTMSTYYSLPGRYLVLMPGADAAGISRKIESAEQRERLRKILDELTVPPGFGVIVRTAGMETSTRELQADLESLLELWRTIESAAEQVKPPALIFQERDLVIRTIRDYFTSDIEEVLIDDEPAYPPGGAGLRRCHVARQGSLRRHAHQQARPDGGFAAAHPLDQGLFVLHGVPDVPGRRHGPDSRGRGARGVPQDPGARRQGRHLGREGIPAARGRPPPAQPEAGRPGAPRGPLQSIDRGGPGRAHEGQPVRDRGGPPRRARGRAHGHRRHGGPGAGLGNAAARAAARRNAGSRGCSAA